MRSHARIAIDSCVLIYVIERNPQYFALASAVMNWIARPGRQGIISTVALTEVLVKPYSSYGTAKAEDIYALLTAHYNLEWIAPDLEIAREAAMLRANYGLKTPDALQAATALQRAATGFVTNDRTFSRITEFETLLLDRLL